MGDRRSDATRLVHQFLKRANFRECLTLRDADGARPIVIALPDDRMGVVISQIEACDGGANVVVARDTDLLIIAMSLADDPSTPGAHPCPKDITIAEYLDRTASPDEVADLRPFEPRFAPSARPVSVPVAV